MFRIKLLVEAIPVNIVFHLSPDYPQCIPAISVSSEDLSRQQCQSVKERLLEKAVELQSEPMIHELLSWFQENPSGFIMMPSIEPPSKSENSTWVALLHLDHMRAKTKYVKIIEKFTSELGLTGRLFLGRVILILLQGPRENIKVNENSVCSEILFCELSYPYCTCHINQMHIVNNHVLLLMFYI